MKTLIISDLHLGNGGPYEIFAGQDALPAMLQEIKPDHLIINGDGIDFLLDNEPIEGLDEERALRQAQAILEHNQDLFRVMKEIPQLTFRLGNHDVELALPQVQALFLNTLDGCEFSMGDQPTFIEENGIRVLLTHGEHKDSSNRVQYSRLLNPKHWHKFRYSAGSHLVKKGLNPLKDAGLRFADLLKPDFEGGFLAAGAVAPGKVAELMNEELLGLLWRFMAAQWASATFSFLGLSLPDQKSLARKALRAYARLHRWTAGESSSGFFSREASEEEIKEASRLQAQYDCDAVILGHSHAARWYEKDRVVYANTGTWIPLIQLPDHEAPVEVWDQFLQSLKDDPGMEGVAKQHLKHCFTAVLVKPWARGLSFSLLEWDGSAVKSLGESKLKRGRRRAPSAHQDREAQAFCYPLLANTQGLSSPRCPTPQGQHEVTRRGKGAPERELAGGTDTNSVRDMGWGIIVVEERAEAYLGAIRLLIEWREQQMAESAVILKVSADEIHEMDQVERWLSEHYWSLHMDKRPRYLLLVGDLHELPIALERSLTGHAMVGRLAFTHPGPNREPVLKDYRAYVEKLLQIEKSTYRRSKPEMLFYGVEDGSQATQIGIEQLLKPALKYLDKSESEAPLPGFRGVHQLSESSFGEPCPETLFEDPAVSDPNLLLSISHGMGCPNDKAQRWALQGAMSFGSEFVTAENLRERCFLPGGLWFYLACFGAGVPSQSVFRGWLEEMGVAELEIDYLLMSLSEQPFISALPQAALANPHGPVGVVSHIDLAWTYGLVEPTVEGSDLELHRRISDPLIRMRIRDGKSPRVGLMLAELGCSLKRYDTRIITLTGAQERPEPTLWMARQDFAAYILLGDPATRLASKNSPL